MVYIEIVVLMCESTGDGCYFFSSQNEVIFSTRSCFFDWYLRLEGEGLVGRSRLSDFKASILVDLAFWTWDAASCSAAPPLDEGCCCGCCCCCCSLIDLVFDGGLECGCGVLVVFNVAKFEVKNMRQKEETKERKIIWQH